MKEEVEKLYRCRLTRAEKDRGPRSLTAAVRDGDLETAKRFIEQGANVHGKTIGGGMPLDMAVNCDHLDMVKWLMSLGANPDPQRGTSSALESVKSLSVLEELLKYGQISDDAKWGGLQSAAKESRFAVAKKLLQSFDDDGTRKTICEKVIVYLRNVAEAYETEPSPQMIALLSDEPVDEEQATLEEERQRAEDENLRQLGVAHYAEKESDILKADEKKDHVASVAKLIATGSFDSELSKPQSSLGISKRHRPTIMEFASNEGLETIVQSCLSRQTAASGDTILFPKAILGLCLSKAAGGGFDRIVKHLLDAGADPNFANHINMTPLIQSIKANNSRTIELLVDAGANLRAQADGGQTPMSETFSVGLGMHQIQSLLREKSKSQAPPANQTKALKIGRTSKRVKRDAGGWPLMEYMNQGHPEWSVLCVQADIESVSHVYASICGAARFESDVANNVVDSCAKYRWAFQLTDSEWTLIVRTLGWIDLEQLEEQEREILELSKSLKTTAIAFCAEDTSNCCGLAVAKNGELTDRMDDWNNETDVDGADVVSQSLSDLNILVPALRVDDNGFETSLVVRGLKQKDIEQVDFFCLNE